MQVPHHRSECRIHSASLKSRPETPVDRDRQHISQFKVQIVWDAEGRTSVSAPSCAGQDPVFRKRMSPRQYYIMCIGPNLYVDEVEGVVPNPLLTVTTLFDVYPTMTCGQGNDYLHLRRVERSLARRKRPKRGDFEPEA
eukprot:1804014-Rhodomonas_salina.5